MPSWGPSVYEGAGAEPGVEVALPPNVESERRGNDPTEISHSARNLRKLRVRGFSTKGRKRSVAVASDDLGS